MKQAHTQRKPARLAKADYEALAQFRHLLRTFAAFSAAAASEAGVTTQQHQALLAIQGFPEREHISVGELAGWLGLRHHSVVGLVDRMAARGLVRRRRDAADGRRVLVDLNAKGRNLLAGLSLAHREELRRLAPLLKRLLARVE